MDTNLSKLKTFGRVKTNVPLAKHTTFKIGGPARFFIEITESEKLVGLLNFLREEGMEYFILGGGSNLLFPDSGFDGIIVKISTTHYSLLSTIIVADAGAPLSRLVELAAAEGLTGLEWAAGIPGTVGGAARGNAGAMGSDTALTAHKVEVWRNGEILTLNSQDCAFGYRDSIFKHNNDVILKIWLKLRKGDKAKTMQAMQDYIMKRSKRAAPYPSSGSFFKNIKLADFPGDKTKLPPHFLERGMVPAGYLIEEAGLRGFTVGGARVSQEHGNFLINPVGRATAADVLELVEKVKETVYNKFGVALEPETEIVR